MTGARRLHLNLNALGAGSHPGAWRWPATTAWSFAELDHYVAAAQHAERGLFDAVFLADTPAIRPEIAVQPQSQGFEPTVLLAALATATEHIGLIATLSTTFNDPYNVARRLQSLDRISQGRVAWNVVVSGSESAAANFGPSQFAGREERYARAEEFVEVVVGLWKGWPSDATPADVEAGVFADQAKLRPIEHVGQHFVVRGPLTLPASPQGHPMILQAGGSPAGRELAARTADAIFSSATDIPSALDYAGDIRRRAARHGRAPESISILPGLLTIIGGTEQEARRRQDELDALSDRSGAISRLAQTLHLDPESLTLDEPIAVTELRDDLTDITASQGAYRAFATLVRQGLTVREILRQTGTGGHRTLVGTPEQIADDIATWFDAGAADGFNLMPDVLADGTPALVDHVVPLLQRRGIFRTDYESTTIRGHYGLAAIEI